jgi:hypothetical protein
MEHADSASQIRISRDRLLRELLEAFESWGVGAYSELQGVSLIKSGRLDSVALFNLALWIEEKIGRPLDPSSFDMPDAWDTADSIIEFIARAQQRPVLAETHGSPSIETFPAVAVAAAPAVAPRFAGVEVLAYEPKHKDQIVSLQTRLWSPDTELNRRFFEWRYERNPLDEDPIVLLACRGNRVVGMRGVFLSRWEHGDSRHAWYCADDLVVAADEEGHGLVSLLTEATCREVAARGHRLLFSLSALRVTRMKLLATGSQSIGTMNPIGRYTTAAHRLDTASRLLRRLPALWRFTEAVPTSQRSTTVFARLEQGSTVRDGDLSIRIADTPECEDMARLVATAASDGRIRHVRDARYLDWRFRNPLHEYRFVFAYRSEKLVGYLVLQRGRSAYADARRINLADWTAETASVLRSLLARTIIASSAPELVTWSAGLGPEESEAFAALGFAPNDPEHRARGLPCILVRGVESDGGLPLGSEPLLDIRNWDVRMIYTSLA